MKDGELFSGRLIADNEREVVLETDRLAGSKEEFPKNAVDWLRPSPVSPMPEGLANVLTREEILDLIDYLRASGASASAK